jgi:hypothetical protein
LQCSLSATAQRPVPHHQKTHVDTPIQRMKYKIRRLRVIQRSLTLIISVVVVGLMVNTYVTFVNHRTIQSGGQTIPIYPVDPITWPTYMMIATGAVSILFNGAIMAAYFWGVGASNRISAWSNYWNYLMHVVNLGIWLATSTTFQMSKGGPDSVPPPRDIYGWTCSSKVDELTGQFKNALPVDFNLQCETQVCLPTLQCIQRTFHPIVANNENR